MGQPSACSSGQKPLSSTTGGPAQLACPCPCPQVPWYLGSAGLLPLPGSPAHTCLGQEPAPGRGQAEESKVCLPGEAHISERGQKPRLQTLLRQHTGIRPAGHSHGVTRPRPGHTASLPVTAEGGGEALSRDSSSRVSPKAPQLAPLSPGRKGLQIIPHTLPHFVFSKAL